MAYDESLRRITLDADSSIGIYTGPPGRPGSTDPNYGKQFCFVKVTGAHEAGLCTAAANEVPIGVLQNKPQAVGVAASVAVAGVTLLHIGTGGVTAGGAVKSDANGKGIAATVGTDTVLGIAIEAGNADEFVPVLLTLGA